MKWTSLITGCVLTSVGMTAMAVVWNDPHAEASSQSILFGAMTGSPKTLDPARSFTAEESEILAQIYEPVLQYHYLRRPYQLVPLTATALPALTCFNAARQPITDCARAAFSQYTITLQPHIYYQPHPAFARTPTGEYRYHHLTPAQLSTIKTLADFKATGTRELIAADYVYQIKRLASPAVQSPIYGVMSDTIVGFRDMARSLAQLGNVTDLRRVPLAGVKVLDQYHYQIEVKGYYPQFRYWLAMLFFCPMPWEADVFYSQPGLAARNITLAWYPVGTGPYYLAENDPNRRMVLRRNPNFHAEYYPAEGTASDAAQGYLQLKNQRLPLIQTVVLELDKESLPRWNKFLQGYYDRSGVSSDSFDQAIHVTPAGKAELTPEMQDHGIYLTTSVEPSIFYLGFNMKDPVVGGYSVAQQKLRQAISIALDYEEYISIFLNGRGSSAQGPIPKGIFGARNRESGINPIVYRWENGHAVRRSIAEARALLAAAGYPEGVDPKTGRALVLNYDAVTLGSPDEKAYFDWLRKQFAKLGIQLNIRTTLYNQFQDNVQKGKAQLFSWGWSADYPDPENFLFLLYGPNGKVDFGGENATNYANPAVDRLFETIRWMPDGPARQAQIDALVSLVRTDAPWVFGFNPAVFVLSHRWMQPSKPNAMARNTLKYLALNPAQRVAKQQQWNRPRVWPLISLLALGGGVAVALGLAYWLRNRKPAVTFINQDKIL